VCAGAAAASICDGWLKLKGKAHQLDSLEKRLNELEQMVQSLAANK
jgi:hypothetical protein